MEYFVTCPYCGDKIWGINPADLANSLSAHLVHGDDEDLCTELPEGSR